MDTVNNKIKVQHKSKKYKYSYFEKEDNVNNSQSLHYALFALLVALIISLLVFLERFH